MSSGEDQSQVGISRENNVRISRKLSILNYSAPSLHFEFFQLFYWEIGMQKSGAGANQ